MAVKCDEYNGVCVLSVEGDLTTEAGAQIRRHAEEGIEQRHVVDFVVDMEKTGFVDSEGLETLLWLKRRCDDLFGRVKLATVEENCRKILEITRLAHRFECYPDLPSALKNMR
jgi:anti-anti-sigma factor